jgi:hypothetical protein
MVLEMLLICAVRLCESGSVVPSHIALDGEIVVSERLYSDLKEFTDVLIIANGNSTIGYGKLGYYRPTKPEHFDQAFTVAYVYDKSYGKKAKLSYAPSIKDCKSYTFEMAKIDTCVDHYYEIWNANEYSKNMTDKQWKETSDSLLYFTFEWQEKNLVYYSTASERVLKHEFKDSGRYIVYTYWQNKCTGIDTFAFNKIVVCPKEQLTNVKSIVKSSDIKIIGYFLN